MSHRTAISNPFSRVTAALPIVGLAGIVVFAAWNTMILVRELMFSLTHNYGLSYTGSLVGYLSLHPEVWYTPLSDAPFLPTIYPPVLLGIVHVVSLPFPNVWVYPIMRVIGYVSGFAAAGVIAYWIYMRTHSDFAGVVSGFVFALSPLVSGVSVQGRVDQLAILWTVLALYYAYTKRNTWGVVIAAGLCVLAGFTKQSAIAAPVAIAFWYTWETRYRDAAVFTGLVGIAGIGGLAALSWATGGRAFNQLVVINQVQPFVESQFYGVTLWFAWTHLAVLVLVSLVYFDPKWTRKVPRLVVLYTGVAGVLGLVMSGKVGSWVGYYLPFFAGCSITLGYIVNGLFRRTVCDRDYVVAGVVVLLIAAQFGLYAAWTPQPGFRSVGQEYAVEFVGDEKVLSEDASVAVHSGSPGFEPLVLKYAMQQGVWTDAKVVRRLESREYVYVVSLQNLTRGEPWVGGRWTRGMVMAVRDNYYLAGENEGYYVYKRL